MVASERGRLGTKANGRRNDRSTSSLQVPFSDNRAHLGALSAYDVGTFRGGKGMTEEPTTFGATLRRLRLAAALTQEELAERAQLSERAIRDLERDRGRGPRR